MKLIHSAMAYYKKCMEKNPIRLQDNIPNRKSIIWTYVVYPIAMLSGIALVLYTYYYDDFSLSYLVLAILFGYYFLGKIYGIYK